MYYHEKGIVEFRIIMKTRMAEFCMIVEKRTMESCITVKHA